MLRIGHHTEARVEAKTAPGCSQAWRPARLPSGLLPTADVGDLHKNIYAAVGARSGNVAATSCGRTIQADDALRGVGRYEKASTFANQIANELPIMA